MRPFAAHEIRGTYATLLLPIREDDSIDFDLIQQELDVFIASGVDGIYSNGTAGEFYAQTEAEFERISRMLGETCERAGMPFQIGCAYPTPLGTLERIARAVEFAPSAVQVILPDWWPTSLQESVLFLRQAAHTAGTIPLVLYHPPHAKRALSPSELSTLCDQIPSLVGLKTGAGDADWYRSMQPVLQRISVFVPGHTLATGFAQGAAGAYSNVACLHPRGAVRWNRLMESDLPQALLIQRLLQRFMNEAILPFREQQGHSNMALDKLLAWIGNWSEMSTRLRPPYLGIDPSHAKGLRERARSEITFLFEED